jgi:hypothetical protein
MVTVYTLRDDKRQIDAVQKATNTTRKLGIMRTHGQFGSEKWWRNIESGKLRVHTLSGVITQVYMGGMRDTPGIAVRSDVGEDSHWLREANSQELDSYYKVGSQIEIDYVLQRHRLFSHGYWPKLFPVVIEIRLGEQKPIPALKRCNAFCYQAAKGSWASCVIILFLLMFSIVGARLVLELISLLLMLTGIGLGIAALFGIQKYGRKGILLPALIGIILNGLLLFTFLTNFIAARAAHIH